MKHPLLLTALLPLLTFAQETTRTERARAHTEHLSSDALRGRGTGSPDARVAAEYIAKQFESIGLEPYAEGSYLQEFELPEDAVDHAGVIEANVIGFVAARKETTRSIVVTAHYDAYGVIETPGTDDAIHNGALDNALGVASMIELARSVHADRAPRQNIVFVATAAEELGLYGSLHYVEHPLFPIEDLSISINLDGMNATGPVDDYFVMPRQGVDFLDEIDAVAKPLGWTRIEPDWMDGMNTNFDTASFLVRGVPAFTLWTGSRPKDGVEREPVEFGPIHTPRDELTDAWNWDGLEDNIALYQAILGFFAEQRVDIAVTDPGLFEQN